MVIESLKIGFVPILYRIQYFSLKYCLIERISLKNNSDDLMNRLL